MTTRHLSKVVEKAREALGNKSFSIAILGFDTQNDTPQAMISYAKKQGIKNADWSLLSADSDTINALSKQLGFLFFTSPNGFDHIVQASVIDAESVVYTQVYGEVFETPLLVEPLKDLVLGRPKPGHALSLGKTSSMNWSIRFAFSALPMIPTVMATISIIRFLLDLLSVPLSFCPA